MGTHTVHLFPWAQKTLDVNLRDENLQNGAHFTASILVLLNPCTHLMELPDNSVNPILRNRPEFNFVSYDILGCRQKTVYTKSTR